MLIVAMVLVMAQAAPTAQAEATRLGGAWMQCLSAAVDATDPGIRPEAVADAALAGCRSGQDAMLVASDRFFESGLTGARLEKMKAQARRQVAGVRKQLIAMVRRNRRN